MKVLGIHYFFPPTKVVASRRLWYLYQRWAEDEVYVITTEQAKNWPQEEHYTHPWQLYHVAGKGIRESITPRGSTTLKTSLKASKLFQWGAAIRHSYPFLYFTDEGGPGYRQAAYQRAVELIEAEQITHLVSSYRPWVDHLIAAKLKKRFPHLIWLADFRDLPVDSVRRDVWWPWLQLRFARQIIKRADAVWAVSQGQATQLGALGKKVEVVYHGLEQLPEPTAPVTTEFVINYTGSIYPGLQSLDSLGEALKTWLSDQKTGYVEVSSHEKYHPKIKLCYAGKDALIFTKWANKYGLLPFCEIQSTITLTAARKLQDSAAVNLLLSWSAPNYYGVLTAKLYDYLAAGRPILALVNGPRDPELAEIIAGCNAGKCLHTAPEQVAAITNWLAELYAVWAHNDGCLHWETDAEKLSRLFARRQG